MLDAKGGVRPSYALVAEWLAGQSKAGLKRKQQEAESLFRRPGITFAVYGERGGGRAADPLRHRPAHHFAPRNGGG